MSGIYEEAIETIINEKVEKLDSKKISNYIASSLDTNFQNPNIFKISSLLDKFEDNLGEKFKKKMPDTAKAALGSIVTHKNSIAHGDTTDFTLNAIIIFYRDSRIIIEEMTPNDAPLIP